MPDEPETCRRRWPRSRSPSCGVRSSSSAWSRASRSTAGRVVVALAVPLPGDDSRAELHRRVIEALGAGARASTGSTSTSATWTKPRSRRSAGDPQGRGAAQPAPGHRRLAQASSGRAAHQPVHRLAHPRARDRVGQGRRGEVVGHHQPLGRARRRAVTASPRSTPTCGASRCRACSASPRRPVSSTTSSSRPRPTASGSSRWASSPAKTRR